MEKITLLDYLTAVGSVATPLLVLVLSAVGWRVKTSIERKNELENQLRGDRVEIYNKILEPFVMLLMSEAAWIQDKRNKGKDKNELATAKMLSLEYRELGFKLSLLGSDSVVRAYNNLMQYFYNIGDEPPKDVELGHMKEMITLLGKFLLEIRRSMGNEATTLDHWDMCEWWMSDARKLRDGKPLS